MNGRSSGKWPVWTGLVAVLLALLAIVVLERERAGLRIETATLAGAPATIWRDEARPAGPLVVLAHGFAGSRQMMQPLAITLARSGFTVVAFDFAGHGRHPRPLTGDVTRLEGATARLVGQTMAVARAALAETGAERLAALVGHSMATDVVIRAAAAPDGPDPAAVVAISMYSDAVTPERPRRLLMVSGAFEGRLRAVALDRLRQLDPAAVEGRTVRAGDVVRRAVAAPLVGHVGVLYSGTTLAEVRDWIRAATGQGAPAPPPVIAPWLLLLLGAIVALAFPLAALFGHPRRVPRLAARDALLVLGVPLLPALAAAAVAPPAPALPAFGPLTAFFGIWGATQLGVLALRGVRPGQVNPAVGLLLLAWGLALFAPALDRYGAAFVPTGPRLGLMALLAAGTLPFALADAALGAHAGWPVRLANKLLPLAALAGLLLARPGMAVAFTVIPVTVLFWLVYGVAARPFVRRAGPAAPGLALGLMLAWALAASTPMIAG